MRNSILLISLLLITLVIFSCGKQEPLAPELTQSEEIAVLAKEGDPEILAKMDQINALLAADGSNLFLNEIHVFSIGVGRPSNRILQQPFRWVPNDSRRDADFDNITYLVDATNQGTASGVSADATEAAFDRAMDTWNDEPALSKVEIVKRGDPGSDPTIFDNLIAQRFGRFGDPFLADIVSAGWYPRALFEALVTGGGRGILAFSVTFIFGSTDAQGNFIPSDINGDNYLDTALNEVYFNDTFGKKGTDRADLPWGINILLRADGIDVETVSLHEQGHSLGIGHFGPPPDAVMNPIYAGQRLSPFPSDQSAMNAVWSSWPNP